MSTVHHFNLRDLQYLVAVARHQHFGRAAEACHVSQPTLSTQVKKLEEALGVTLIERTNRQVMLTPVGERIIEQARTVLTDVAELERIAEQARDRFGGVLRLGLIPTVAPYVLPKILPLLHKALPTLELQLVEDQTAHLTADLLAGELDAVLLALPLHEERIREVALYREPFRLATSRKHPLAKREAVTLADLDSEKVLLLEDGHCLRDQALAVCGRAGAVENTNFSATSIETLRQMVAADIGITLVPELAITGTTRGLAYIPFSGEPPHREIGLCWRRSTTREELLEKIADVLAGARLVA